MRSMRHSFRLFGSLMILTLSCGLTVRSQTPANDSQDISALLLEVKELKRRLAEIEDKLAIKVAAAPVAMPRSTEVARATPATPPPPATAPAQVPTPASAPPTAAAPFAFGDFTWMNGQSRQKSQ